MPSVGQQLSVRTHLFPLPLHRTYGKTCHVCACMHLKQPSNSSRPQARLVLLLYSSCFLLRSCPSAACIITRFSTFGELTKTFSRTIHVSFARTTPTVYTADIYSFLFWFIQMIRSTFRRYGNESFIKLCLPMSPFDWKNMIE